MTDKLSPAEQARKDVEEWISGCALDLHDEPFAAWVKDNLIARLTPVYERAQAGPYGWGVDHWRKLAQERGIERDALRERAERFVVLHAHEVEMRSDAEADAKRLRGVLEKFEAATWDRHYGKGLSAEYARSISSEIREALAAPNRKG